MRVGVVGGGASGLVTLKYLTTAHKFFPGEPIEARLFETAAEIGGVFFHHVYEDAELVSSKYLTTFSDFPPRNNDADFLSAERYAQYLKEYATYYNLWKKIHLSTTVKSIRRGEAGGHVITYTSTDGKEQEWACDAVAICSGLHQVPNVPDIHGVENVPVVLHSSEFKHTQQFGVGKTVMVLGSGETSFDICALAMKEPTNNVVLCHRHGWLGAPRKLPNIRLLPGLRGMPKDGKPFAKDAIPVDVSKLSLFSSMYVNAALRNSMFLWEHYNFLWWKLLWAFTGSSVGFNQFVGSVPQDNMHVSKLFFNKAWDRVAHYISPPHRPKDTYADRIRRFFIDTPTEDAGRYIDVAPFPTYFDKNGAAHFKDNDSQEFQNVKGRVIKPDVLIFATGYLQNFPFFEGGSNEGNQIYPLACDADVRAIWKHDDPTVGFIGFVRPNFGAIPPLAELQAMLFTANLLGRVPNKLDPEDEWHYRLIKSPSARVAYGVEHDSYAYQLARDMDMAPSFTEVIRLGSANGNGAWWKLPYICFASGNFVTKFRLRGPWAWDGAVPIMTSYLFQAVGRRKTFTAHMVLTFVPVLLLATTQLLFLIYVGIFDVLSNVGLTEPVKRVNKAKILIEELAIEEANMKEG